MTHWSDLPKLKPRWKDPLIYFVVIHVALAWIFGLALLANWVIKRFAA